MKSDKYKVDLKDNPRKLFSDDPELMEYIFDRLIPRIIERDAFRINWSHAEEIK